jgi:ribosomal protein S18 acetylase RimI-like enzyme
MRNFTVRQLEASDSQIAWQLAGELLGDPPDQEASMVELLSDKHSIVLAAFDGTNPVGYLVAYTFPSLNGDKLAYLYDIEVASSARRQGIGTRMVALLREICKRTSINGIWVGSSLTNEPACALWAHTGAIRVSDQYVEFIYEL